MSIRLLLPQAVASAATPTGVDAVANGLTLEAATGVLSGSPLTAGSQNFTVTVKDSAGATASKAYTLTVNPAG
jgi:hypothetical protein